MNNISSNIGPEKPTAKAVNALVSESPASSGWHAGFSTEFNGLPPRWAVVFDGEISGRAVEAARKSGLDVTYRDGCAGKRITDVSLPKVGRDGLNEAVEAFNKFAGLYKEINKRVAAVVNRYVNGDPEVVVTRIAGYDREKLQPGYKGKFMVHLHNADKAGLHRDLRIEFPVESLKKALKSYGGKRGDTPEPMEKEYPDKPGTVYRSFVTKKKLPPAKDDKVLMIETENHPIEYGRFHGEITEGYGKGTVEIWDKGTYILVDAEGDKKYVIDFHGGKIDGRYALVKFKNGYLMVKTSYEKKASAIDYVRPTLPKDVWDLKPGCPAPKLRPEIRHSVLRTLAAALSGKGFESPSWIKGVCISGSSTSYNYKEDGDLDIDVSYDPMCAKELNKGLEGKSDKEVHEYLKKIIYAENSNPVPGTGFTYSYLVLEPGDMPVSEGVYDVLGDRWVRGPVKIPLDFNPDGAFLGQRIEADRIARQVDLLIGRIIRAIDGLKKLDQFETNNFTLGSKRSIIIKGIKQDCENLDWWYNYIWRLPEDAKSPEGARYPAFNFSPNWEERNIVFKYLARSGYHRPVHMLYQTLKGDPYLKLINQFISD